MIIKELYVIPDLFIQEALSYATLSRSYTSNRHDFHPGGLDNKQQKMYQGKLGEKAFKMFLLDNQVSFLEDTSPHTEADHYDFLLPNNLKIDVKTRTKHFHTRTLEMVEQVIRTPKDIYVSTRLLDDQKSVILLGWFTRSDLLTTNPIENNGYLDNYVMYDKNLRPMHQLYTNYLKQHIL